MADEVTLDQVQEAVDALHAEVKTIQEKTGSTDHDAIERIQKFLDKAEDQNQELVLAQKTLEGQADEIKELKDQLEKKGVESGKIREQVDALVLAQARGGHKSHEGVDYRESEEYKALNNFCKHGLAGMPEEEKQLLRTDDNIEGGFLLAPTELDSEITKTITEIDPIRTISRVRTVGTKNMSIPIRNVIPVATYEGEAETGTDSVSNYTSETLTPFRQTFTSPVTQDQLMDSAFDMASEIASDAGEAFAFGEGAAFVSGSGFKEPEGFLTNADVQANDRDGASGGLITGEDIILLTGDLKTGYNPVYVLNRRTLATIRTLRSASGDAGNLDGPFLWAPGFQDRGAAGPQQGNTINGFPYVLANSMPDIAATNRPLAFGDFRRGYTIVDRTGMSVIRDEFTLKKRAIVEFTMNRWNTAQVTLAEAITALQITA